MIPLRRRTVCVPPRVCGVVEGARIDDSPVQEVAPCVVRIPVCVKDVRYTELAHGEDQALGRRLSRKLIDAAVDFLLLATQVDSLPAEYPRYARVRVTVTHLVGFTTRKAGQP